MDSRSTLYQEQKDALESLVNWFSDPKKWDYTAVVVMPTGAGKTGVICCLPYTIGAAVKTDKIPRDQINMDKSILIITPSLAILKQMKENLSEKGFLNKRGLLQEKDIAHNAFYTVHTVESSRDIPSLTGRKTDITLSNSQKWREQKDGTPVYADLQKDMFSLVIVDEAHHLPATQWEEIVNKFREHAKIIFFTATPERADGREITTDGAIHAKGYAYYLTRSQAIKKKLIRNLNFKELSHPPPLSNVPLPTDDLRMKYAEVVLGEMHQLMQTKNREQPLPGNKNHAAIVITKNIAEANHVYGLCVDELQLAEEKVKVMHSAKQKTKKEKEEAMLDIRNGTVEVVIIVKMLLEGFDHPPLSIAVILTPIQSMVKFAQFIGRVQRLVNDPSKKEGITANILTHEYFEQKERYDEYIKPRISETENELLDEDIDEDNANGTSSD